MQRELALKTGLICLIALLLLIPLNIISGKISERKSYLQQAETSIAKSWTSAQQLMTPFLVQPYEIKRAIHSGDTTTDVIVVEENLFIPLDEVNVSVDINTSLRHKGIYSVPVYDATVAINGKLTPGTLNKRREEAENQHGFFRFLKPHITIYVSDARGITGKPTLSWKGDNLQVSPGSGIQGPASGLQAAIEIPNEIYKPLELNLAFQLRGMSSLQIIPASTNTEITMQSNWPHPEFIGAFLPLEHGISKNGFSAQWRINEFSSDISKKLEQCSKGRCSFITELKTGTHFYQSVDIYLQTERAVKYGILFIAISFAAFFLF